MSEPSAFAVEHSEDRVMTGCKGYCDGQPLEEIVQRILAIGWVIYR